jgi:hypothetical protein
MLWRIPFRFSNKNSWRRAKCASIAPRIVTSPGAIQWAPLPAEPPRAGVVSASPAVCILQGIAQRDRGLNAGATGLPTSLIAYLISARLLADFHMSVLSCSARGHSTRCWALGAFSNRSFLVSSSRFLYCTCATCMIINLAIPSIVAKNRSRQLQRNIRGSDIFVRLELNRSRSGLTGRTLASGRAR